MKAINRAGGRESSRGPERVSPWDVERTWLVESQTLPGSLGRQAGSAGESRKEVWT